jgi:hypothetical protein
MNTAARRLLDPEAGLQAFATHAISNIHIELAGTQAYSEACLFSYCRVAGVRDKVEAVFGPAYVLGIRDKSDAVYRRD